MRSLPTTALLLLGAALTTPTAGAETQDQPQLTIFNDPSTGYVYHGCWNETTGIPNTTQQRALYGGKVEIKPDEMTVQRCLEFCSTGAADAQGGSSGKYKYAGLEYARECWCGTTLNGLSVQLKDEDCDLPCEGDQTQRCGGSWKLTVYVLNSAGRASPWSLAGLVAIGAAMSLAMM
ncbi:hypothetical protein VTJ04DRAFT_3693 [Mycothermus thermophilus]|uniref:uncharacterized protein n=1 Tax=Humicola insolens TaxID=85995 RepID=UPI0037445E3E